MLTFEQKLDIISSYPELVRKDVSLGRINFQFEDSLYDKKNVVFHLHRNGNGYIYAGLVDGAPVDDKGFLNLRDLSEDEIRSWIEKSIASLSVREEEPVVPSKRSRKRAKKEQTWTNAEGQKLLVKYEDELWYVYSGLSLESAFETVEEAEQYLAEEGFSPPAG
ncbi:hypothetical protein [Paenibacillus methanolicus]|uniref:Uncharacterized protein n=1 Tax=Paenibacillus methanolicus TaxID=582686 RepID=A0A5S5CLW7_9BACL|nr:hypothetical protein [Paenibacillus methanolicus]TYP79501.1 hypothetical protein BCM02_101619 [Paenibacillus methanolicus]